MSIQITSTTDTPENVKAAMAVKTISGKPVEEAKQSASSDSEKSEKTQDETTEASDATENLEDQESESSESGDDSDELKDETQEDQKPKKKNGFKRRIDKLTAAKTRAEQEVEFWKQQAMSGKPAKTEEQKPQEQKTQGSVEGKPKADNFDTHEEYVDALTDWKFEQKQKEVAQKATAEKAKAELVESFNKFQAKVEDFAKSKTDFHEVVESVDEIPLSATLQDAIITSDVGPELMYELAKHPKELARINSLHPLAVAREIGKIEARLASGTSKQNESKQTTKAPPPISPVGSKSVKIEKTLDDPSLTQAEYEALRAKQKKA